MKTAGVIVTYNRKDLLVKNIEMQYKQKKRLDKLIIVDNNSKDGTYEWVREKGLLEDGFIDYRRLDKNTGGAGGFSFGTQYAYEQGYDFIYLMDDDGKPYDENTFEIIYNAAVKLRKVSNKLLLNSLVTTDGISLSFPGTFAKNFEKEKKLISLELQKKDPLLLKRANPFNGTLISKELIKEVGVPNADFFMMCDEVDYFYRCMGAGCLIATVAKSIYLHPKCKSNNKYIFGYGFTIFDTDREYYFLRNKTKSYDKSRKFKLWFIYMARCFAIVFFEDQRMKRLKNMQQAVRDAKKNRMGEKKPEESGHRRKA